MSCVPLPPLSSCHTTLQIHFLSRLVTKENQIILKSVLSSRSGNYCHKGASLCLSVTSLMFGIMLWLPDTCSAPATSLRADSSQVRGLGGRGQSNPLWSPLDHLAGVKHPSPALYSDLIWRGVAGPLIRNATHCFITLATDNLVSNLSSRQIRMYDRRSIMIS